MIVPSLQRAGLLRQALSSLVDQTFTDWEALVVDDGSTDDSEVMVKRLAAEHPRIRWLRRERDPPGASTCRNMGIAAARGRYLVFLDSDDVLAPYCLQQRMEYLRERDGLGYAVFPMLLFHEAPLDQPLLWNVLIPAEADPATALLRFLARDPPWQTSMPIWRKEAVARLGGWSEGASNWQDWDLHVRALASGLAYDLVATAPDCFLRRGPQPRISDDDVGAAAVRDKAALFARVRALPVSSAWSARHAREFRRLLAHYAERTALLGRSWEAVETLLASAPDWPRWLITYLRVQQRLSADRVPVLRGALYRLVRLLRAPLLVSAPWRGLHQHALSRRALASLQEAWPRRVPPADIDWAHELSVPTTHVG